MRSVRGRLTRSSSRIIGGVCAGLAEHFGIPALVVRVLFAAGTLALGVLPGIAVYGALWLVLPPSWADR
jgi:phage shock protein PspC (stress-responsive transcriptional regulator)